MVSFILCVCVCVRERERERLEEIFYGCFTKNMVIYIPPYVVGERVVGRGRCKKADGGRFCFFFIVAFYVGCLRVL
jgi:hypothetical protein